jgi:flagellar biosynthesis protein FlhA
LLLAGGVGGLGWNLRQQALIPEKAPHAPAKTERESVESLLRVEPLAIEVGLGLVKLVDAAQGGTLLRRIAGVRRQLASELGFVLPPVRVTDNLSLKPREYVVLLKGAEIARFELQANQQLAIDPGQAQGKLAGTSCREPAFGLPATWIPAEQVDKARLMGYTVVDPANVVATHLTELIRSHAHEIFSRHDTASYLDRVRQENPSLVDDLTPKLMSQSLVQRILQNLLRERVSIRDAVTILESLAEAGTATKNTALLTDFVRQSISRGVVKPYLNEKGELPAFLLDPKLEQTVQSGIEHSEMMMRVALAPQTIRDLIERVARAVGALQGPAALVCSTSVRFALRQIVETELPLLAVLSHAEIPPQVKVVSLGAVS